MEEMMRQAAVEMVDIAATWKKTNVNQRHELVRGLFPEGLVFSHKRRFFEPANTMIWEMIRRGLDDPYNVGVPDGI